MVKVKLTQTRRNIVVAGMGQFVDPLVLELLDTIKTSVSSLWFEEMFAINLGRTFNDRNDFLHLQSTTTATTTTSTVVKRRKRNESDILNPKARKKMRPGVVAKSKSNDDFI